MEALNIFCPFTEIDKKRGKKMTRRTECRPSNSPSLPGGISDEIRKLVCRGEPMLTPKDKLELDAWLNEFKRKRFGKQGFESWLANNPID